MAEEASQETSEETKAKRPRWKKKRWWAFGIFLGLLVWIDGPGWRLIGEKAAAHFLPGLNSEFELSGRLTGGNIGISNFGLTDMAAIELVGLDQAALDYKLSEIIKGKVRSLRLKGLHAEIDLAKSKPEEEDEKEPVDPAELIENLRQRLIPMEIVLEDISIRIRSDKEELFALQPTSLTHQPDSSLIELDLGEMQILGDKTVPAQGSTIDWQEGRLQLSSLEVLPSLEIRELEARLPIGDAMNFSTGLLVDNVRFDLATNLSTASITKAEEPLLIHQATENLGFPLPVTATLDSLEVNAEGIEGGPEAISSTVSLGLRSIDFDDWTSERIDLDLSLEGNQVDAVLDGEALGSPLRLDALTTIDRSNNLLPIRSEVTLSIPDLEVPLRVVRDRFTPSDEPVDPPASSLTVQAEIDFSDGMPQTANSRIALISSEEAPPVNVEAIWQHEGLAEATVLTPGIELSGQFDQAALSYSGNASIEEFDPTTLDPWLQPFGIAVPEGMQTSLNWKGEGKIEDGTHQGGLEIERFEWQRDPEQQAIKAFATANYEWPKSLELTPLNIQQAAQKVEGDVRLEDRLLELRKLSWTDGEDVLLNGTASIPVPEDLSDLKAMMRETRPIEVDIESTELPLSKLHPYLPEETQFRTDSRAKLDVKLTGSMAAPVLDARLTATNLGVVSQPDLPLISIDMSAVGREQTLKLEGDVSSTDYPPMTIDAVTNWDPDHWAENPDDIKKAKLDASAKLSDFNLNLLSRFVPDARTLEGILNVDLEVTGTVGEPQPLGTVTLSDAKIEMNDPTLPRFKDVQAKVVANMDRVSLENFSADVSGGNLKVRGALDLDDGKPSALDFTITGRELPARRDDSMIVRLNTDISIKGPWEGASIGGQVALVDSLFYKDIELLPIGVPFNQPSEPNLPQFDAPGGGDPTAAVPKPFDAWSLDLKVLTKDAFMIRGNLATGEVLVDLRVGGTAGDPKPSGTVTLSGVEAKLPFSKLKIKKGEVIFNPNKPFDPTLNIRGESTVRPYEINVYIYGPVSNPKVLPTSSPPLPEEEIMTLIATGTTTSGFEDPEAATARAAQLLIEEIRSGRVKYLNRLGPVLKLFERVDFQVGEADPYTSTKYNSATINLSDNWLLRAGISEEANTRTTLIYLFRFK